MTARGRLLSSRHLGTSPLAQGGLYRLTSAGLPKRPPDLRQPAPGQLSKVSAGQPAAGNGQQRHHVPRKPATGQYRAQQWWHQLRANRGPAHRLTLRWRTVSSSNAMMMPFN